VWTAICICSLLVCHYYHRLDVTDFLEALLYYDHLLTLGALSVHQLPENQPLLISLPSESEVKFIWTRPRTFSSFMFFLNRYFSFGGNIVIMLSMFAVSSLVSSPLVFLSDLSSIFYARGQLISLILAQY
jgi:hypothetical protein